MRKSTLIQISFVIILGAPLFAHAAPPPTAPASSSTGTYTVGYPRSVDYGGEPCAAVLLEEQRPGSFSWTVLPDVNNDGRVEVSGRNNGTYKYRTHAICFEEFFGLENDAYSAPVLVVVNTGTVAELPSIEEQIRLDYRTRIGDLTNDGRKDIFLHRMDNGTPNDGTLGSLIFQQLADGTFAAIVPTSSQALIAAGWPVADLRVDREDIDLDGALDIGIGRVGEAIPGAQNFTVIAAGEPYELQPSGILQATDVLADLLSDLDAWSSEPSYFDDSAVDQTIAFFGWEYRCGFDFFFELRYTCDWQPTLVTRTITTYPGVNPAAVLLYQTYQRFENGTATFSEFETELEELLGIDIGLPNLCEVLEPALYGSPDNFCKRVAIGHAIGKLHDLLRRLDDDEPGEEYLWGRQKGRVYVTHRTVFASVVKGHLALEYWPPGNEETYTTLSADARGPLAFGTLQKRLNYDKDTPWTMRTIAATTNGLPDFLYWAQLVDQFTNYPNDTLDYDLTPSGTDCSYNSNSFVAGMINAADGEILYGAPLFWFPTLMARRFPGFTKPVPSVFFRPNPPGDCP